MTIKNLINLRSLNTFSMNVFAKNVVIAYTEKKLFHLWKQYKEKNQPVLLLGDGSNILFLENYDGTILLNRIGGISINEDNKFWHLHVGSGEIWHKLVTYSIDRNMPGLENLALIPGRVGSAPIQNIGAYGMELQNVCEYVEIIHLNNGEKFRLSTDECQFGYRDSIFKKKLRNNYAIVAVGIQLCKNWKKILTYGKLSRINTKNTTPKKIFNTICTMRINNLPNLSKIGNAGSFFKNPILDQATAYQIFKRYPNIPYDYQSDGKVKLSAGWLIDCCKLKGYKIGQAAVYKKKSLILVNCGQATSNEILELARYVRQQVSNKFSINLEPEIRFIASKGEIDAEIIF